MNIEVRDIKILQAGDLEQRHIIECRKRRKDGMCV